jgi:hypothetical protein
VLGLAPALEFSDFSMPTFLAIFRATGITPSTDTSQETVKIGDTYRPVSENVSTLIRFISERKGY